MKKILLFISLLPLLASAQYDSTRTWQSVNGDGFIWKNGQFNGAVIFPNDTPRVKYAQSAIGFKNGVPYYKGAYTNFWGSFASVGSGSVTNFTAGNFSPLFNTSVATATSTPALTFIPLPQSAYTIYGNNAGSSAAPNFFSPILAGPLFQNQGTATIVLHGNAAGNPSWGAVNLATDVTGILPAANGGNPMTAVGDMIRGGVAGVQTRLPGNTTTVIQALTSTGDGVNATAPAWTNTLPYVASSNPLPGNHIALLPGNASVTDVVTTATFADGVVPGQCPVTWTGSGLTFNIGTPCNYTIAGTQYSYPGGNITLNAADPSNPRQTAIVVNTSSSATSVDGVAQTNPEVPTVSATELILTSVFVDAGATTPTQVGQVVVRDVNYAAGDWFMSRTATIDSIYATNPFHSTLSVRLTAATNNQYFQYNSRAGALFSKSAYNTLLLYIRNNSVLNAARTLTLRLFNGATQVGVALNLTTYGYIKTTLGVYQTIAIPMSAFTGADNFSAIRITNTGTGGTVDVQFDYVQLQSGIVSGNPQPQIVTDILNIAALRATQIYATLPGSTANVLGYYSANDGGGGRFYYDATSTATDNGGTIIKPTLISGSGRWIRVNINGRLNVKWFGAIGDDATDNITFFRNTITAAVTPYSGVDIPEGTYQLSDSILITTNISFSGIGGSNGLNNTSFLRFAANKSGLVVKTPASAVTVDNLFVKGSGTDTTKNGLWFNTKIVSSNLAIQGFPGHGLFGDTRVSGNADLSRFVYLRLDGNIHDGIHLEGGDCNSITFDQFSVTANGRNNVWDNGFLGNNYHDGHSSFAGMLAGQVSWVTHGGNYYVYTWMAPSTGIEPQVTSGWQNYWQLMAGADNPSVVSAWSGSTKYFPSSAFAIVGDNAYSHVSGLYTEGGQGGVILRGYSLMEGGDNGAGFVQWQSNNSFIGSETVGVITAQADIKVNSSTDNNSYTALTRGSGLVVGYTGFNNIAYLPYNDTLVRLVSQNSSGHSTMQFGLQGLTGARFGRLGTMGNDPVVMFKKNGLFLSDSTGTSFRNILAVGGINKIPFGTYANGDIAFNISNNDTLGYKYYSGAWHEVGRGGGGGGATAFTGLSDVPASYSGQANKVVSVKSDESGLEFTTAGGSLTGATSDGTVFQMQAASGASTIQVKSPNSSYKYYVSIDNTAQTIISSDGSYIQKTNAGQTYAWWINSANVMNIGTNGNVSIGNTGSANSLLEVHGSLAASYVAKTSNYTADATNYTIDCTSGTFTVTLPTAVGIQGRLYVISNSGAGVITVATTSSQTFTNVATTPTTLTIGTVGARTVQSNGANWILISSL